MSITLPTTVGSERRRIAFSASAGSPQCASVCEIAHAGAHIVPLLGLGDLPRGGRQRVAGIPSSNMRLPVRRRSSGVELHTRNRQPLRTEPCGSQTTAGSTRMGPEVPLLACQLRVATIVSFSAGRCGGGKLASLWAALTDGGLCCKFVKACFFSKEINDQREWTSRNRAVARIRLVAPGRLVLFWPRFGTEDSLSRDDV